MNYRVWGYLCQMDAVVNGAVHMAVLMTLKNALLYRKGKDSVVLGRVFTAEILNVRLIFNRLFATKKGEKYS